MALEASAKRGLRAVRRVRTDKAVELRRHSHHVDLLDFRIPRRRRVGALSYSEKAYH